QYLNLVDYAVGRLEAHRNLLERRRAAQRDEPLRRQADALEDGALLLDHVEQRLLHLIRHVRIEDIDVEPGRVPGADAGAQFARAIIGPGADRIDVQLNVLPAVDRRALATGQHRDRFITEREVAHTARGDGGLQPLMRQRR